MAFTSSGLDYEISPYTGLARENGIRAVEICALVI